MLTAFIRRPSPLLAHCQLTFIERQTIDFARALEQHRQYESLLRSLGAHTQRLPDAPDFPDAVFVEDTAVVVDELAIVASMASAARKGEIDSVASALATHRTLRFLSSEATLDGGDVLQAGKHIFVGQSTRTNARAMQELQEHLGPHGYVVTPIEVRGCLHLKSGVSHLGRDTVLVNRSWIDPKPFDRFECLDTPDDEPSSANTLTIDDTVVMPASFPRTADLLVQRGFHIATVDVSEFQRAEGGVTCLSLLVRNI